MSRWPHPFLALLFFLYTRLLSYNREYDQGFGARQGRGSQGRTGAGSPHTRPCAARPSAASGAGAGPDAGLRNNSSGGNRRGEALKGPFFHALEHEVLVQTPMGSDVFYLFLCERLPVPKALQMDSAGTGPEGRPISRRLCETVGLAGRPLWN